MIKNEDLILGQISLAPLKRSYAESINSYKENLRVCRKVFVRDLYLALVFAAGLALVFAAGLALVFAAGLALAFLAWVALALAGMALAVSGVASIL